MLFGRKKSPLLGIDISSTSIKLLEFGCNGQRYYVESYDIETVPSNSIIERNIVDVQLVGEAISRAVKKSGTRAQTAACAVSGSAVITKVISMPSNLSEDELEIQIRFEADQYIPYPLEEVSLDFEVLGPAENDPDKVDVLLAASRSDNIEVRVAALEQGGLKAKIIDVEAFALEKGISFMMRERGSADRGDTIAVVDIGATLTSLNVLKDLKIIYTREQTFGGRQLTEEIQRRYGLSYEEAGLAKRRGGLPDNYVPEVLEPFKQTLALEANRALQFFYASRQISTVDQIILAGGCASIPGIDELVETTTGIRTNIADPFADMDLSPRVGAQGLRNDAPALLIACGLALRGFD
jgi:type IV pilus assembly protein PilM